MGTALGLYSVFTGKDLITGEDVSRWGAVAGVGLSFVPFGGIISKGKKFAGIGKEVLEHTDDMAAAAKRADELVAAERGVLGSGQNYTGGAYGRLSSQAGVIERHHTPPNSLGFTTKYSGPAIQMDYADHLLTSSHSRMGLEGIAYRTEIQGLIDSGNMRGAMAREVWDIRRAAVQGGGSVSKYNGATREMLDFTYGKGWLGK